MNNDQIIRDAQYRKGLSIAYFNATNAAIELVKLEEHKTDEERRNRLAFWRNWLLEEHKTYYATVIANIGTNYSASESIAKLRATTTVAELKSVWLSLSEDERHDAEILKVKDEMKKAHEKA
jgi:hypothetical protein